MQGVKPPDIRDGNLFRVCGVYKDAINLFVEIWHHQRMRQYTISLEQGRPLDSYGESDEINLITPTSYQYALGAMGDAFVRGLYSVR